MAEPGGIPNLGDSAGSNSAPARVLAALVDPETLRVIWASEAVYAYVAERGGTPSQVALLDEAIPMATAIGLAGLVRAVGETGVPAHRTATIVSTVRGSATLVISIYRPPGANVLVIAENSWSAEGRTPSGISRDRPKRRR